jgi:hypothetical protein
MMCSVAENMVALGMLRGPGGCTVGWELDKRKGIRRHGIKREK